MSEIIFILSFLTSCFCGIKIYRFNLPPLSKIFWLLFSFVPVLGPIFFYMAFYAPKENRANLRNRGPLAGRYSFGRDVKMPTYEEIEQELALEEKENDSKR